MQFGLLGPLEVRDGEHLVDVPGPRLRRLLVRLLVEAGRPVSARALVDVVWGDDVPAEPTNALQSLVSRLRRVLADPVAVEQVRGAYRIVAAPADVDAFRFAALVRRGSELLQQDSAADAVDVLGSALALWRGEPLSDLGDDAWAEPERARLGELRVQAQRDRLEARARCGDDVTGEAERLAADHPLREDLVMLRMSGLVAADRPAEALAAFESTRRLLAETFGADPSPALQSKHLEVLRLQAAASADAPTNLREQMTSFVGRGPDVARVEALLGAGRAGSRLVTLVGAGGSGKTRLASEVAASWVGRASDGVWFVELAPVSDPEDLAVAVLDAIGVRDVRLMEQSSGDRPQRAARTRVLEALARADALLVVDNCEHVVDAAAALVEEIVGRCPGVRVIATSREPLGVAGEVLHPLKPLAVPGAGDEPQGDVDRRGDLDALAEVPAVRLLLDRSGAAGSTLRLDSTTAPAVVEVVRRLDGLPLAIELAAARLRVLSIDEVADRLADRFRLLTGGRRTAVARHRTLRAVVEWSWDLLEPFEREVAERFSVFGAGASVDAVVAVCSSPPDGAGTPVEDVLHALVDKSILVAVPGPDGTRFRMLETLREFGAERLESSGRIAAVRQAHALHYSQVAARADSGLRTSDQLRSLRVMDTERDNVLAALAFLAESGDGRRAVELVLRLGWYWMLRENGREASRWLRLALAAPGATESPLHPLAVAVDVVTAFALPGDRRDGQGDPDVMRSARAGRDGVEGAPSDPHPLLAIAAPLEHLRDQHQLAALMHPLLLFFAGERQAAMAATERNLAASDAWVRAATRSTRVAFAENDGDLDQMRRDVAVGLGEWEAIGDHWGMAAARMSRGQLRTLDGDLVGAADDLETALRHLRQLGGGADDLMVNVRLADLRLRSGDAAGARGILEVVRSDRRYRELGAARDLMVELTAAGIAAAEGDLALRDAGYESLLRIVRDLGEPDAFQAHGAAVAYAHLGATDVDRGDLATALDHLAEAQRLAVLTDDQPIIAVCGVAVAELALALDAPHDAAEVLGASAHLRGADDATQPRLMRLTERLRAVVPQEFDTAYERGRALDRTGAVERTDPARLQGQARRR